MDNNSKNSDVLIHGIDIVKWQNLTWVDIKQPNQETMQWVAQHYSFHPLNIDDCLSKVHSPKIDDYENYIFIILHFPVFDKSQRITIPSQVSIFLGRDFLVSVHSGNLKPLNNLPQTCRSDDRICSDYLGKDSCYLLYQILDDLVDYCFPIVDGSLSSLDKIGDKLNDAKSDASQDVTILRRDIAAQRRIIRMVREVMNGLSPKLRPYTQIDLKVYFDDINDHLDHLWNDIEECHETIEIYKDNYSLLRQERINRIMAVLTILFTISLPATVLSTYFGMHVNIPWGTENGGWVGPLGTYTSFIVLVLVSVLLALIMFIFFRRRRWL